MICSDSYSNYVNTNANTKSNTFLPKKSVVLTGDPPIQIKKAPMCLPMNQSSSHTRPILLIDANVDLMAITFSSG